MDFWDANFLKNIGFRPVFNGSKEISEYFAITEYLLFSRHISRCSSRIYTVLHGYKLLLTSYVGLKITKNVTFLQLLCFFHF